LASVIAMNDMFRSAEAKKKQLRPHQELAIALLRQSLAAGNRRVVIQGPTGFGKTLVAAKIVEGAAAKNKRVIFTAPAISLIDQTVAAFEAEGLTGIGVMQSNHPRTNPDMPLQISSVQTLARRVMPEASLVIVDECHIRSEVIERMMDERPDLFFVGLSATPWAKGMGLRWQDLVIPATIGDLIDGGYLSKFTAYAPYVPDLSGVKVQAGEYVEAGLEEVMGGAHIVGGVVQTWLEKGQNRPTLCFAVNRAHAANLQQEFLRVGVSAEYVDGWTDRIERAHINKRFVRGEVRVICSVRTMTTGVDLPVSCIIDAAPTKSEILHVQKIGRGLRVNPGTEDCLILDHAGNSIRLGLVTDILHQTLDKTPPGEKAKPREKAEKLPKECANCGALHAGKVCPFCGHERKPVAGVDEADGELVQLSGDKPGYTKADKQAWWSGIQTIRQARGKSEGWAAHTYRDRFGVWPRGLSDVAGPASPDMWNFVKAKAIRWAKKQEGKRA
jgi:superfamily II DNA or RNA helicase